MSHRAKSSAPRYPVYVISKGRSDVCYTARFLIEDRVDFRLVVEPQEADAYAAKFGRERLLVLPFSNLGFGSIPARNWVWEHALSAGAARHWILDDNIGCVYRRWKARKILCDSGVALRVCEDFVDRYENIAVAGMNAYQFCHNRVKYPPFNLNVHVYSCLLISCSLPNRWRGRYNEDTDLCLQVLADGWCTILFNAFLIQKGHTTGPHQLKGGNSDLYKGDGRLKMARSLERQWPGVVEVRRRFQRPQHVVKNAWRSFDTPLKKKPGAGRRTAANEYGLELEVLRPQKNVAMREMADAAMKKKSARGARERSSAP